jgi:tRNA(fMet)-specific endonuclease VapC
MHLLDTNILTAMHTGHPRILKALEKVDDPEIATTIVNQIELLQGRIGEAAAAQFDQLSQIPSLRKIGRADLLIGTIALANRATLVTRNTKDFKRIPGLKLVNWFD